MPKTRPFYEMIVEEINECPSTKAVFRLFRLIEKTEITKNHDAIIAAIDKFFDFSGSDKYARTIREITESILAQKALIVSDEEKSKDKFLRVCFKMYGLKIGRQLAKEMEAAGDDLTKQRDAIINAAQASHSPLKDGENQRINTPCTKNKKP